MMEPRLKTIQTIIIIHRSGPGCLGHIPKPLSASGRWFTRSNFESHRKEIQSSNVMVSMVSENTALERSYDP